jgi:hypothetical protein
VANRAADDRKIGGCGAVPTEAAARTKATSRASHKWAKPAAYSVHVRCQRFSRLCVLMNPYPAGLEIHPDLAGECAFLTEKAQ